MRVLLAMLLVCLYTSLLAPNSEFGKTLNIIDKECKRQGFSRFENKLTLGLFFTESSRLKNVSICEPKYIKKFNKCIQAHGPGQILYATAIGWEVGFKGSESELRKVEVSVPLSIKFLAHLRKIYRGDWHKIISHYKSGKPYHKKYYVLAEKYSKKIAVDNR